MKRTEKNICSSDLPIEVKLGERFTLCWGEKAVLANTELTLQLLEVSSEYGGHRFEELGDEYEATVRLTYQDDIDLKEFCWWERENPPGKVLTYHGYDIEILGCSTGHFRKQRCVSFRII